MMSSFCLAMHSGIYQLLHVVPDLTKKVTTSTIVGYIKGKSALMIYDRYPNMMSKWNKGFWARGYYVATVGNITEDAIKKYISEQQEADIKEESRRS